MMQTGLIRPIGELIARQATSNPAKLAFRDARRATTYGALAATTANLAGHLAALGVEPGDRVAIWLPNSVEWVESCFGIARAGGVSVPISYDAVEPEVVYRLVDAACKVVITTDERAAAVAGMRAEATDVRAVVLVDRGERATDGVRFRDIAGTACSIAPRDPTDLHAPAYIVYTSGTTGRAKGVLLTNHGMLWVTAACWAPMLGLGEADHVVSPLPLFHSYALNLCVLSVLAVGASETILERFSTPAVLEHLEAGDATFLPGVPTMFHYLLQGLGDARPAGGKRWPNLRLAVSAGAIMPATLNREFEARTGALLLDGYGITETSTMVVCNWPSGARVPGSCGIPVPGLQTRIVSAADGRDVDPGEEGELIVRGPCVMPGYHNKPRETADAIRNGWYHTGDLARADENGYVTITGRLKELVIRGGQNIAPAEVEEAVQKFAGVLDCAVIGVEHAQLGEVPVVFVVAKPGASIDPEALVAHCRTQLSAYKVPAAVHLTADIPRTGSGKIMRFKLRDRLRAG